MNNTIPRYDLLPLFWWENPWIVGSIIFGITLVIILLCYVWRRYRTKTPQPLSPLEQWLENLHRLKTEIHTQHFLPQHAYDTLLCVLRGYAHIYHGLYNESHTDEEFVEVLKNATTNVSPQFLDITCTLTEEAYHVKFANVLFPRDYVDNHITALITFLEQKQKSELSESQK